MKWQYRYIAFGDATPKRCLTEILNEHGAVGWEAFACDAFGIWLKKRVE